VKFRIICDHIGHWRSKRAARFVAYNWRSKCLFCGTKLVRVAPGVWKPVDSARWIDPHQTERNGNPG
jgi:hypothetical protein